MNTLSLSSRNGVCAPFLALYVALREGSEAEELTARVRRALRIGPYLPTEETYNAPRRFAENTANFPWQFGNCTDAEDEASLHRARAAAARDDLSAIEAETRRYHRGARPSSDACEAALARLSTRGPPHVARGLARAIEPHKGA